MDVARLGNGLEVPLIGLGTWQLTDRDLVKQVIGGAYEKGYRLIDTAAAYGNEIAIARAIRELGINRHELLLADKAWNTSRGHDAVMQACKASCKKLKTDYLDLYLVHWPASMRVHENWEEVNADTWRGMEDLYKEGLARAVGVCNFKVHHLEALRKTAEIMPHINQVELHPGMAQRDLCPYCRECGIQLEASSPLGNGQILNNDALSEIARRYGKSTAQVCLRWIIQKEIIAIPKASNAEHLQGNLDVLDFELSDHDMGAIDAVPYCGGIGIDPDEVVEFG